jgi:hypothetical protein
MKTPENTHENAVSASDVTSVTNDSIQSESSASTAPKASKSPENHRRNPTRTVLPRQWMLHEEEGFKPFYYRLSSFPKVPYKGVARWRALGVDNEALSREKLYTSKKYVIVDKVPNDIAREYIRQNHYLRDINAAEITYGLYVFKRPEYKEMFQGGKPYPARYNKFNVFPRLIGVAIYGNPVAASAWSSISNVIRNSRQVKELKRLFIADHVLHAMKNGESKLISGSIDGIKNDFPDVKAIITYAAPDQLHKGTIYQAANFRFQPTNPPSKKQFQAYSVISKQRYEDGWTQSKALGLNGISSTERSLKQHFGYPVGLKNYSYKFRYIFQIVRSKKESDRVKEIEQFENGATKYPISPTFPDKQFIKDEQEFYSKLKVWYNENECITYKSNLDPERFFVHPKVLEEEKARLEKRLKEINDHLDMIVR